MLAMNDPLDSQCQSSKCKHLEKLERVVFAFFAAEMLAKMIAMGITGHKAYFSDRWNILDFLIVVAGYKLIFFYSFIQILAFYNKRFLLRFLIC